MATIAELLREAAGSLEEPYRAADLLAWFRTNAPAVKESSIRAHIQALTGNATNRLQNFPVLGARPAVLYRLEHGLYRTWQPADYESIPEGAAKPSRADVPASGVVSAVGLPARAEWSWEGNVQAVLISWLAARGWRILRVADTQSRESGTDVVAQRATAVLHIEVKGWPSTRYVDPRRAKEQKRSTASGQARVWFADAVLHALRLREAHAQDMVAIAFPLTPTYVNLTTAIIGSLNATRVSALFVAQTDEVEVSGAMGQLIE